RALSGRRAGAAVGALREARAGVAFVAGVAVWVGAARGLARGGAADVLVAGLGLNRRARSAAARGRERLDAGRARRAPALRSRIPAGGEARAVAASAAGRTVTQACPTQAVRSAGHGRADAEQARHVARLALPAARAVAAQTVDAISVRALPRRG